MKTLSRSGLSREAVIALIKDKTGFNKNVIRLVMDNLENLEKTWLK